jgi:peptide maturation system protein (TIGR04066 family)
MIEQRGGVPANCRLTPGYQEANSILRKIIDSTRIRLEFEKYILPKVIKTIEAGKDIIFTLFLKGDILKTISKECDAHGVNFKYYNYIDTQEAFQAIAYEHEYIYDIDAPVIFVLGTGERTNKFEIQLALREGIAGMGYKISQVGTRAYCGLLGFHSFPRFMYSNTISETNKVVLFNHFIKKLEKDEGPDVIIIGVPGGVMPFNNRLPNRFGILAYEVSQAVTPDTAAFSCYYADYYPDYFSKMAEALKYRLGCKVDCYNMSNIMFDWTDSKNLNRPIYSSVNSSFVNQKIRNYQRLATPVFNVSSSDGAAGMAEYLISRLAEYGETECR